MDKLLVIADDLTGALDVSVSFAEAGISTCVGQGDYFLTSEDAFRCSVQVTVVPSRHMTKTEAFESVYAVTQKASKLGFTCIYKKTDSALRGNVGAELEAVLKATGEKNLYFVPAFPKMNRVTSRGIQYIDGNIPVAESVFASDPFNPVRHSSVAETIAETSCIPAFSGSVEAESYRPGVAIFDAETDEQIEQIAVHLFGTAGARLVAGCAGLSNVLGKVLDFPRSATAEAGLSSKLIVFCGSINPISLNQCTQAERRGAPRFHLIQNGVAGDEAELASRIAEAAETNQITIFDTGSTQVDTGSADAAESGQRIAEKVSKVISGVYRRAAEAILFIIGGDTLIAFINNLGVKTIIPVEELFPGVVLAKYQYGGEWHYLISKSGGFGEPDLLEKTSLKLSLPGAMRKAGGV